MTHSLPPRKPVAEGLVPPTAGIFQDQVLLHTALQPAPERDFIEFIVGPGPAQQQLAAAQLPLGLPEQLKRLFGNDDCPRGL